MTLRTARRRSPYTMTSTIKRTLTSAAVAMCALFVSVGAFADEPKGEMNLVLPDFTSVQFLGMTGWNLLALGLVVCALGLVFGLVIYQQLKNLPVHKSMLEISELIYETCKTYLVTQGKFILLLEVLHRRHHRRLLRRARSTGRHRRGRSSSSPSASSASPAATASPGSASASTPSPTRAPRSPSLARQAVTRPTRSRSRPA